MLKRDAAIILDEDKQYLAESRLTSLLNSEGYSSVQVLLERARGNPSGELQRKIVDAMTNNETWFFRDLDPFEALQRHILVDLIERRKRDRRLKIWSAAASTGQEAYSIAMLIRENFPELLAWDLSILGTDISDRVLERAREGRFTQFEVNRGLPAKLLAKYFDGCNGDWQLLPAVTRMVRFEKLNLAEAVHPSPVDIVLLRNVLIYFGVDTKKDILRRVARVMAPDGYLFLGCAETTLNLSEEFEKIECGRMFCYRLRDRGKS